MKNFVKNLKSSLFGALIITFIVFSFLGLINLIKIDLDFMNPLQDAFSDFDLTDLYYSHFRDSYKDASKVENELDIVLVNIGYLNRFETAQLINIINEGKPKVIGIDVFYEGDKEPKMDSALEASFVATDNLVLVSDIIIDSTTADTKLKAVKMGKSSLERFITHASLGFANFDTQGTQFDFVTFRSFYPKAKFKDSEVHFFPIKIVEKYKPEFAKKFLDRNNNKEFINFSGSVFFKFLGENVTSAEPIYPAFDWLDIVDEFTFEKHEFFDPMVFKDKIVLMGFMGPDMLTPDFEDRRITPFNKNYIGRATPDMYGVIAHANIISMILNEDYINEMGFWGNLLMSIFFCYITTALFSFIYLTSDFWYDGLVLVFQFLVALAVLTLVVYAFDWYRYKIDFTLSIFSIILSGFFVELYYGLVTKIIYKSRIKKVEKQENYEAD